MARTFTQEEREERIRKVGEYFLATNDSTREIARHFSETEFRISNCTVCMYIHLFMKKMPEYGYTINEMIFTNSEKTIDDPAVRARVIKVAALFLSGLTVEQVAEASGIDRWVIYRDLVKRLPLIDESVAADVRSMLTANSRKNLSHGK